MIEKLRIKNQKLIDEYSLTGNIKLLKKQMLIKTILSDNDCFNKIQMIDSIKILMDLGYTQEQALEEYKKLISFKK
ncbi:MAG: hypothetical protein IJW32_00905 [Clostridia bacterium]|nr:hypothetical protein [Clostridia bacterium]